MAPLISRFLKNTDGATAIEYGLIAALLAMGLIGALTSLKTSIGDTFDTVGTTLKAAK